MVYRTVDCGTWDDPWFAALDPHGKLFFLYLITNRRSTSCGAFEITVRQMVFETGLPATEVETFLGGWQPRVHWWPEFQIVWIRNFYRRQVHNEKTRINARRIVATLPPPVRAAIAEAYAELSPSADRVSIPYPEGMGSGINRTEQAREQTENRTSSPPPPQPAADAAGLPACSSYETQLNGGLPAFVDRFHAIDPLLDETWFRGALRRSESRVGPLPTKRLREGLGIAHHELELRFQAAAAKRAAAVTWPGKFAESVIVGQLERRKP